MVIGFNQKISDQKEILLDITDAITVKKIGCQPFQRKVSNKDVKTATGISMLLICGKIIMMKIIENRKRPFMITKNLI